MSKLNIEVKYSALYRPQSIGMLERQHRGLKDSLRAALEDMGQQHQDKWLDFLPWVLLGRRVAYQPDLGASSSELTYGQNVRIPGQLLCDPGEIEDFPTLQKLLRQVRLKTTGEAVQPSNHSLPEKQLAGVPEGATHAFTRQHQATGLQAHFEGPFRIDSRVSRSVIKLEVGVYKDGTKRYELRHINDLKFAHPDSLAAEAKRPALGRKPTTSPAGGRDTTDAKAQLPLAPPEEEPQLNRSDPNPTSETRLVQSKQDGAGAGKLVEINHETSMPDGRVVSKPAGSGKIQNQNFETLTGSRPHPDYLRKGPLITRQMFDKWTPDLLGIPSSRPVRSTRNPNPLYVDSISVSGPPPKLGFPPSKPAAWSASRSDLAEINNSISARR